MISKLWLYYNTIKFLSFKQIFFRIVNLFIIKKLKYSANYSICNFKNKLIKIEKTKKIFVSPNLVNIHKKKFVIDENFDWNNTKFSSLEIYNLHYLDLLSETNKNNYKFIKKIILIWIQSNKDLKKSGWDPYPTSLRIVNITKWLLNNKSDNYKINESLFIQARWLNKNIEYHLSGNHVISNAKALIFAGLYFNNSEAKKWLSKGLRLFTKTINQQTNADGGHYERSPMYHSIVTEDILDVINIINASKVDIDKTTIDTLFQKSKYFLEWYYYLCHPDGLPAFFGDTNFDSSLDIKYLQKYFSLINNKILNNVSNSFVKDLESSGYYSVRNKNIYLILDTGDTKKLDQPGHSHAALLSYEASFQNFRFIVNSGISTYADTNQRSYERSTRAHNTVEINSSNSQEVWKSFRLARRGYTFDKQIENNPENHVISIKHNGYLIQNKKDRIVHHRTWQINENDLIIIDEIYGNFKTAISRIYFHPNIVIMNNKNLKLPNDNLVSFDTNCNDYSIKESLWYPQYNMTQKNKFLEIKIGKSPLKTIFKLI